jgi:hypothetical protein
MSNLALRPVGAWSVLPRARGISLPAMIKVSGRLSGKSRSRGHAWGLGVLVCARVLPGQTPYLRQLDHAVIHGKEKVYGSIP